MRRSIVSLVSVLSFCVSFAGTARAQQSTEKATQPATEKSATTQPAQPTTATRPAADEKKQPALVDPSGSWKWQIDFGGNTADLILKLNWDGKKLDGKYTAFESTTKVEEGKVDKDGFSFVVRPDFGGNQIEIKFKGKVDKDDVKGTINLDFGNGPQDSDWAAKRFLDEEDVIGVWELKTEFPGGNPFESTLTVTKDDKGLHAKTSSDFGEFEGKNVKIKDNQFVFELSSNNAEMNFKSTYTATPRGNSVEGKSAYDFNGNTGEMKFTGKRRPPKDEKKTEPTKSEPVRPADDKKDAKQPSSSGKSDGK